MDAITVYDVMGFHSAKTVPFAYIDKSGEELSSTCSAIKFNVYKILSYIPIVSILVASLNLRQVIHEDAGSCAYRAFVIFQSIVQIAGLGIVFLLPDLIVSGHRAFIAESV